MTPRMRRAFMAASGVVVLVVVVMTIDRDDASTTASLVRAAGQPSAASSDQDPVVDLKLELLEGKRADLDEPERDPFRFRPRPAPPPPRPAPKIQPPVPVAPPAPVGPPPPPPIPLRFIGLVDAPTQAGRVAIVSDGRGNVFYGKEGDTIEGRYKMLRVSPDAIELAYLDGRGRQIIRLTGQ